MECLNGIRVRTAKFCRIHLRCQVLFAFTTDIHSKFTESISTSVQIFTLKSSYVEKQDMNCLRRKTLLRNTVDEGCGVILYGKNVE